MLMTRHMILLVVVSLLVFCGQAATQTEANKAVLDRWVEMWKTADLTIADEIFATDLAAHIPHYPDADDLEGYKEEVARGPSYISDWDATIEDLIAEGDKVVGRFAAGGIWQPFGISYTNTMIIIFRFVDGKIAEEWWEFDMLGVQQQMGAIPPMPEGPPAMQRQDREDFIWSAPSDVTGDPGDPASNKAVVQREFAAWSQGDLDTLMTVLDEVYAPDFVYHDPARPHVTDLASYKQWAAEECLAPFPDLSMPIDDIIAEGDKVVVRWTFTGTHIALGREITQTGITIARIADGKVVEAWCACDMLGTIMQLTAEEWPLTGSWYGTNSYGHVILLTITPLGSDGERFACSGDITHDPSFGGMFPDAVAETTVRGALARTGLNTYAFTLMSYGLGEPAMAEGSPRQIVYIMVASGDLMVTGANTMRADSYTAAVFAPDQDPFGDEPPAYGCVPVSATYKRVPVVPPRELPPAE